ncbi:MAG: Sporulation kinase E [Pelotomaculum sp. PtaB.Bin013]|uniref:histidine kinase n=1 Tax=Pelotomaculum isophthalicicum JI TaxID=947010 RepID=A0A9X4JV76_9FIRM|nr:sensor histidine kinase [Pelotomaculum isophthalicicum]MDF9407018.1 PAS domain S-box protein [Pelotomaculum isophthalicicum JI]OPX90797.1 MAG: Sporulation kinase E [Pelotomaculum sp. PtaB.Bin013]
MRIKTNDADKTKEQLINELVEMRQKVNAVENLLRRTEEELLKRDKLLKGVADATKRLLAVDNYISAITDALAIIGEAVAVDRVYIFENHLHPETGEKLVSQRFEWSRDSVKPQIDNPYLQNASYDAQGMTRWYVLLSAGKSISGPIKEFPTAERELLEQQEILSLLVVPVIVGDKYWGFIGFDDCHSERKWSKNEESILTAVAASFGEALERRRAEEALRLSEERFYKAFNFSPNLMAVSTFDGRFIDVNDSFLRATGYRREEVLGYTIFELNTLAKPEEGDKLIRMLNEQGRINNMETHFRAKTGEVRVGLYSGEIISIEGRKCILGIINDITELKKIEKEMARLDRLHLVGEMAACIGHEIRNPITAVRGFLQLLKKNKEDAKNKEYFGIMIEELDRTNTIITEFLSLAKNKAVDLKAQNLNSIIKSLSPLLAADAMNSNKSVEVELGEIPDLLLDEKEIRQLILNLARNGLEAMSSGGNLYVRTYVDNNNNEVVLSLRDQGKGIEPDILEKIGTPFFTTKDNGTGLGLAVCYGIAARHKAAIKVETYSTGTTFYVRFKL